MFSQATFKTSPCIRTTLALALSCNSNPFGALHSLLGTLYALWFSLFLQPPWWNKKCNGSFYYKTQKSNTSSGETNSKSSIPEPRKTLERKEWMNALKRTLDTILQSMVWLWYISQFFTVVTCLRSMSTTSLEILEASFFNCSILASVSCSSLFTFAPESPLVCFFFAEVKFSHQ